MIGYKKTTKFARSSVDKLAPTLPLMTTKVDLLRNKKKKKNNCKTKVLLACITLLILGSATIFQGHRLTPF